MEGTREEGENSLRSEDANRTELSNLELLSLEEDLRVCLKVFVGFGVKKWGGEGWYL